MRVLWGLAVVGFSAVFASGEVLATRGGAALSESGKRILFQKLSRNAGAAILQSMTSGKANNSAWIVIKDLNLGDDKWKIVDQVVRQDRVATFGEINEFILNNLASPNAQGKQWLEESGLHLYIAVRHTPTLLSHLQNRHG